MKNAGVPGLMLLALLTVTSNAHTWVEQLMVIAPNGTFIGAPGYARGNVPRTAANFNDAAMVHLLSSTGPMNLTDVSGDMCMDSQKKQVQSEGNPRLQAAGGDSIALRYQENGHVTLPDNQKGKPKNRGTVYVYGTTDPKEDERLETIHRVWNQDGTGGDKRGVLLSVQNFDDGQCYQINGGEISKQRQADFPHEADQLMGADLWCQQDIKLPENLPSDKPYTLYWVWDWPTARGVDPALPNGKQELYTTCIDVDVVNKPNQQERIPSGFVDGQSLNTAAVKSQFVETMGSESDGPVSDDGESASSTSQAATSPSQTPTPSPDVDMANKAKRKQLIPGDFVEGHSLNTPAIKARFVGTMGSKFDVPVSDDSASASSTWQAATSKSHTSTTSSTSAGSKSGQHKLGHGNAGLIKSSKPAVSGKPTATRKSSGRVSLSTFMTVVKTAEPSDY